MNGPRIGSLCSGYGGLDMGVQSVLGGSVAWHVEYDRDPSRILAHHWPDVPNHGDVKLTNWAAVEPVEILTAGYPCQPFSHAGKRKGADDPRHLWPDVARAIGALRPGLVVLENVRGHVSLGLADVLGDLSGLGYDATWGVVRAADAGAPHGRARIFIVATPDADNGAANRQRSRTASGRRGQGATADAERAHGWAATGDSRASGEHLGPARRLKGATSPGRDRATTPGAGSGPLARPAAAGDGLSVAAERGHLAPADAGNDGRTQGVAGGLAAELTGAQGAGDAASDTAGDRRGEGGTESARLVGGSDAAVSGGAVAPNADGDGLAWLAGLPAERRAVHGDSGSDPDGRGPSVEWGAYAPAIARWEHVIGRPAPRPTEPGRNGPRLSPAFVEWLMGLPAGHVTDVPDLSRNAQLKALGNGVVPQQAALAIRTLLNVRSAAA